MTYRIVHRTWRLRMPMWLLMIPELMGLIAVLVLFGIEQPDLYRTLFWQIGYDNGLNSNPNMVLYALANYKEPPKVPFVWAQSQTDFNVAVSVIVLFFLLVKLIAWIMKVWYPILALVVNLALVGLWTTSAYGQAGPDYADETRPSSVAWYIRMGCGIAKPYDAVKLCYLAKGTFAVTIVMLFIFLCNLGLAIHSMLPNELDRVEDEENDDDDDDSDHKGRGVNVEMHGMRSPTSTQVPFTPRTMAFRTLDRKNPHTYA